MATMLDAVIRLRDNFSNTLQQVERNIGGFSRTATNMGKDIQKVGKDLTRFGGDLTKKITLPIIGIGAAAVKIGMDFESSMSKVRAMSRATSEQMKLLEKAARDAGAATSKSAKESADALGYMALAGWDVETSIKGLMPVLRLSEAGNIDLARASSLVTDSMSAMGIEVKDLPKYLDVVAQTARSANTDIDQMAEAYLGVGGALRGLKVPLDESALALGFMANAGIKGSEAGTSLNAILTNLTAPAGKAKRALQQLNYSAFDSKGNFKGLETVLFDLQGKLSKMNTEQRNMYLSMIGGKEHIKGVNALLNGLDDSYVDLKKSISEADGALDEVAKTMLDNNKGSIVTLKSAIEELGLKIYDVLKPAIANIVDVLQKFTNKLNELTPKQQETIIKMLGIAAAVGPVIMIIGKLTTGVGRAFVTFGRFAGVVKRLGLLKAIFSPGVIVVGTILALVAAGYLLYKNWDKIKAKVNEVFPNLKEQIGTTLEYVKNIFDGTVKFALMVWGLMVPGLTTMWETVKNIFWVGVEFIGSLVGNLLQIFSGIIDFITGVFTGDWELAWSGITDIFGGIFGGIEAVGKATINGVIGLINGAIGGMNKIKLPDWLPGKLAGKGISIPLIPQLAKGTPNWGGGIVQVHERGGEIIDLPGGSRVYPHDKSIAMARSQGRRESLKSIIVQKLADTIVVREEADIDKIANAIVSKIEQAEFNMA